MMRSVTDAAAASSVSGSTRARSSESPTHTESNPSRSAFTTSSSSPRAEPPASS
nr:hypothetical protein [Nocardia wallacei]